MIATCIRYFGVFLTRLAPYPVFLFLFFGATVKAETSEGIPEASQSPSKQAVADLVLLDEDQHEQEKIINAIIQQGFEDGTGKGRLQGKVLDELSPRGAALLALEKNLAIQRSRVSEQIARAALLEAKALFNPVISLSFSFDRSETFDRVENDERFREATSLDDQGNNVLQEDNPEDPRDVTVEFNQPRERGFFPTRVVASQAPLTGATEGLNYGVELTQQLPWGANFQLVYQALDRETFFVNNPSAFNNVSNPSDITTVGSYERPWVSSLLLRLATPMPYSKDFGPYSEQNIAVKFAALGNERAYWDIQSEINNTLLTVDLAYWDFVNNLLELNAVIENRNIVEAMLRRTNRSFENREATNYDKAQAESELARVKELEEFAWNRYVVASNTLVQLLDIDQNRLLIPSEYMAVLNEAFDIGHPATDSQAESQAESMADSENPDLAGQSVDVKLAALEKQRRKVRLRPDVNLVSQARLSQNNGVFGYDSFGESAVNVFDPDLISQRHGLEYVYPWGNVAVKAGYSRAEHSAQRQDLLLKQTSNRIRRDLQNAKIALTSANKQITITENNVKLARLAYEKALNKWQDGGVPQYELVVQSSNLLVARLDNIRSLILRKRSEAQLLAAAGRLAKDYALRTAQTDFDHYRLALFQANGALQYFGDARQ